MKRQFLIKPQISFLPRKKSFFKQKKVEDGEEREMKRKIKRWRERKTQKERIRKTLNLAELRENNRKTMTKLRLL